MDVNAQVKTGICALEEDYLSEWRIETKEELPFPFWFKREYVSQFPVAINKT